MGSTRVLSLRRNLLPVYPFGGPERFPVPEDKIDWSVKWDEYIPPGFTIPAITKGDKPWADPEIGKDVFYPKWNTLNGCLNRCSYEGMYHIDADGYPLNPMGRTGIKLRGSLGRWGPNHAADAIVTRWKRDEEDGSHITKSDKPILQFIAITRNDNGQLAIPGGMVEPGEEPVNAAKRELLEEVFSLDDKDDKNRTELQTRMEGILKEFNDNNTTYRGYVDDRRNTDNSWIETCAVHFHLEGDTINNFNSIKLEAGSDASSAAWVDIHGHLNLYASHYSLIEQVVNSFSSVFWL